MRAAYIEIMDGRNNGADQANSRMRLLAPPDGPGEPTTGSIKRAMHDLSRTLSGSVQRDAGAPLREAYDLLRRLALRNGIDPDDAMQRSRAAVESQRDRMVLASTAGSDQTST
jgi:hypothetical protein